ncbi:hypothetical protein HGRIS_011814 [Hohenbuehelia grisea]|uniref:Fungal N-terminal domain-containing protein n=1 Tax=Hohenbuehelia grisea TaxID=104357 RepID=A0ABR3JXP2_9AGAR
MDPLSLSTSVLAFVGASRKLRDLFSQASSNRENLAELKESVLLSLHDIQGLLPLNDSGLGPVAQAKLQADLSRLQRELERVHTQCSKYSGRPLGTLLGGLTSSLRSWIHSKSIEADIARLDRVLQRFYIRFLILTSTDARCAALRIEQNLVTKRSSERNQILRLERAFTTMVAEHDPEIRPVWISSNITKLDLDYLLRQVNKIVKAFDWKTFGGAVHGESPSGHHEQEHPYPVTPWSSSMESIFHLCLIEACHSIDLLVAPSGSQAMPIQRSAKALLFLSFYLRQLGLDDDVVRLLQCSIELYSGLHAGFPCLQYQRCLASALLTASCHIQAAESLSYSQKALDLHEDLYTSSSDIRDMHGMIVALGLHTWNLQQIGFLDKGLDSAQQRLLLQMEYMILSKGRPSNRSRSIATWCASGEADVVLSSQRQFSMPSYEAMSTCSSLWSLASILASLGRYAEARVAGMDAIACLEAVLYVDAWVAEPARGWNQVKLQRWGDVATWVSVSRGPGSNTYERKDLQGMEGLELEAKDGITFDSP